MATTTKTRSSTKKQSRPKRSTMKPTGFTAPGTDQKPRPVERSFVDAVVAGIESGQSYRQLADGLAAKKVKPPKGLGDLYRAVRVVAHSKYGSTEKAKAALQKARAKQATASK